MKLSKSDWASIVGFVVGMGAASFSGAPIWAAFFCGIIASVVVGLLWTAIEHWDSVKKAYIKGLEEYDKTHNGKFNECKIRKNKR